jgi:branched-subunit amino acid transport protein
MNAESDPYVLAAIAGMTVITVVTRSFFFISSKQWKLPRWAERGLQYAPVAALAAVIAPEVLATGGELVTTWRDARLFGALAGVLCFRLLGRSVLGTIIVGMIVYLPLHVGLGW